MLFYLQACDLCDFTCNTGGVEDDSTWDLNLILCWSQVAASPFKQVLHAFSHLTLSHFHCLSVP